MSRFSRALDPVLEHEGGYVNHPDDPGGATNKGITQRTYDSFMEAEGRSPRDVRDIENEHVKRIYREQYWDAVRADDLPPGVAYAVFDAAVNSGPGRAVRWLQQVVGADVDGIVGKQTLAAVRKYDDGPIGLIEDYNDKRLAFMQSLGHWDTFKNGWTRRVNDVTKQAVKWIEKPEDVSDKTSGEAQGKAEGKQDLTKLVKRALKNKRSIPAAGGVVSGVASLIASSGPLQWAAAFALVAGVVTAIYLVIRELD